jgi:hypothetical protein
MTSQETARRQREAAAQTVGVQRFDGVLGARRMKTAPIDSAQRQQNPKRRNKNLIGPNQGHD